MRNKRVWSKEFVKYMKLIVGNKNYYGLPNKFRKNGDILWVSPSDKERSVWWNKKKTELHCTSRAEVARIIHPKELKGYKPCQICGKELSIFYVYPNKNTLKKLNNINKELKFSPFIEQIDKIVTKILDKEGKDKGLVILKNIFKISKKENVIDNNIVSFIKENRKSMLSPGVMSNPPDRLDGFHTYNACCRSKEDTGRHRSNLVRYTQDRRVYENWADGNWNLSNRLMGEFNRYGVKIKCPKCGKVRKMTADHIGPISLGFTHRPKFNPLCSTCNSAKNNRMTLSDVKELIKDEKSGAQVISWHSKYIWDALKNKVKTQGNALLISKLMRTNLHCVLTLFSRINDAGYGEFLKRYLHPEYSYFDYKFIDFNPIDGPKKIEKKPLNSQNKRKNAQRYVRIAFESLDKYKEVNNRNIKIWTSIDIDNLMKLLINDLEQKDYLNATAIIRQILEQFSKTAVTIYEKES